ncbi:MAG: spore germination protein [Bacillota bacterium]
MPRLRFVKPRPMKALTPRPAGQPRPGDGAAPVSWSGGADHGAGSGAGGGEGGGAGGAGDQPQDPIPKDISQVKERLKAGAGGSGDVVMRELEAGPDRVRMLLVYVDGLVNKAIIDQHIIAPMVRAGRHGRGVAPGPDFSCPEELAKRVLSTSQFKVEEDFGRMEAAFCTGSTAVFIDGADRGLSIETRGWEKRAVSHPETERSTRGSREGFVETISTNLALVRRHIKDPAFRAEMTTVGRRTHTQVAILWVDGLTNPALVDAVRKRLTAIDVDRVIESYEVEYFLKDNPWTPFPLIRATERPDFCARELLEGRIAVLTEDSPFGLIMPATIVDFYRTSDDYVHNYAAVALVRMIRLAANLLVLFLTAGYVALVDFHPELLPTDLAVSIAGSREGVPFPAIVEVVLMLTVFEILHEATIRLPGMMGPTLGTVGGLVIGQAAVQAKIISDVMVIIIAAQAISAFTPPSIEMSLTWRVLLWGSVLSAGVLGLYGLVLYTLFLIAHISALTSLGLPYTLPNAPLSPAGQKDNIIRLPFQYLVKRPGFLKPLDQVKRRPYDRPAEHPDLGGQTTGRPDV